MRLGNTKRAQEGSDSEDSPKEYSLFNSLDEQQAAEESEPNSEITSAHHHNLNHDHLEVERPGCDWMVVLYHSRGGV